MPRHRLTWIVVADGARARILARREQGGFDSISAWESAEAHRPSRDLVSDRPGRAQESATTARHALDQRHDPHEERKIDFVRDLAERINRAAAENRFDDFVLFAPPRCLGTLREALDETARAKLRASAAKDLTKLPPDELAAHVDTLFPGGSGRAAP
jgi:protein required for attachment to host cells